MKFNSFLFAIATLLAIAFNTACNDPTVIGSDLLSGDQLDIEFTDTVTIRTYNVKVDSIITYNPEVFTNTSNFPIGIMEDPVFGISSSGVYAQPTLNVNLPDYDSDNPNHDLDSAVLVLPYNAKGSYGNLLETYSLEVYRLTDVFPDTQLYSNQSFPADTLIGQISYTPTINDSTEITVHGTTDTRVKLPPQLRIRLDQNMFENDLFAIDTPYSSVVADFERFLRGIYIKPTSVNKGMPSFTMRSQSTGNSNINAGIRVYYHADTTYSEYLFPIFSGNVVTANYEHNYSSSPLNLETDFIGEDATYTDSILLIQGMSGTNFVVEIPHSENLSNKVLNKAELVFHVKTLLEDEPTVYLPVDQIVVSEIQDDGTLKLVDDYIFAVQKTEDFASLFGGDYQDDTYRVNITTHLQDMSRGLVTEKMMITLFPKAEQAARMVVSGPGNSQNPAKLHLTFTNF